VGKSATISAVLVTLASFGTVAVKAWSAKDDAKQEIAKPIDDRFEHQDRMFKNLVEDLNFRLATMNRRVQACEEAFTNPMVGRTRTQKVYDSLLAAPLAEPQPTERLAD